MKILALVFLSLFIFSKDTVISLSLPPPKEVINNMLTKNKVTFSNNLQRIIKFEHFNYPKYVSTYEKQNNNNYLSII